MTTVPKSGVGIFDADVSVIVPDPLDRVGPADIARLFGRQPSWFDRAGRRAQLYAAGFPRPITRGVWLKRAVVAYILRAGNSNEPAQPGTAAPSAVSAAPQEATEDAMRRTREFLARKRRARA